MALLVNSEESTAATSCVGELFVAIAICRYYHHRQVPIARAFLGPVRVPHSPKWGASLTVLPRRTKGITRLPEFEANTSRLD